MVIGEENHAPLRRFINVRRELYERLIALTTFGSVTIMNRFSSE